MRVPQAPLSEEESREASALLEESGGRNLVFARGAFAAVATSPTEISPTEWLPMLLGDQVPNAGSLKRLLALMMREYNACADCLALSVPAVPDLSDEAAVQSFAKGYVQVAQKDAAWTTDPTAFELTAPLMMLSGYVPPESLAKLDTSIAQSPEEYIRARRLSLPDDVAALYSHFAEARVKQKAASTPAEEKPGRNDPCPCGSGKKFKKCCAA